MDPSANNKKQSRHDGSQTRAVSVVVVVGALPQWEAIREEVVITFPTGTTKDVGDEGETRLLLARLLDCGFYFGRSRWFDARLLLLGIALSSVGPELLLDLVRVEGTSLLAVGFRDVVLRGRGRNSQDVVECRTRVRLVGCDFVANAENFTIYVALSDPFTNRMAGEQLDIPSLLQAAVRGLKRARSPTERYEIFMLS